MKTSRLYIVVAEISEDGYEGILDFLDPRTYEHKATLVFGDGTAHSESFVQRFWRDLNA